MAYALITGASKGIGKALAKELAAKGYDLLLVARSAGLLSELKSKLKKETGREVHTLDLDLSEPQADLKVFEWCEKNHFSISVLVNNAGYGLWGNFEELSLEEQNNMMQLNMLFLVNLTYRLIPRLKKEKSSFILNVGSTAAYQSVPTLSLYAATKAFVVNFSRGLRHELKKSSISVTCLSPGGTKTGFVERSRMHHMEKTAEKLSMTPEAVAKVAIAGLFKKKAEIIPGFINKFSVGIINFIPKSWIEKTAHNLYRKK